MNRSDMKHQSWTTAITFAEAGEWDTARSFMPSLRRSKLAVWFENLCMAVTFAEHGMHEEAVRIANTGAAAVPVRPRNFFELCALDNVRCTFGALSPVKLGIN